MGGPLMWPFFRRTTKKNLQLLGVGPRVAFSLLNRVRSIRLSRGHLNTDLNSHIIRSESIDAGCTIQHWTLVNS